MAMKLLELKAARARTGRDQHEVAQRARILYSRYVRIENGYTAPTPAEVRAIARALQVPMEEAFPVAATA